MRLYTVYDHPSDYPDKWVVRAWWVDSGQMYAGGVHLAETLDDARDGIPRRAELHRLEPTPLDDATIAEVWI
jgi:hypothetical protein